MSHGLRSPLALLAALVLLCTGTASVAEPETRHFTDERGDTEHPSVDIVDIRHIRVGQQIDVEFDVAGETYPNATPGAFAIYALWLQFTNSDGANERHLLTFDTSRVDDGSIRDTRGYWHSVDGEMQETPMCNYEMLRTSPSTVEFRHGDDCPAMPADEDLRYIVTAGRADSYEMEQTNDRAGFDPSFREPTPIATTPAPTYPVLFDGDNRTADWHPLVPTEEAARTAQVFTEPACSTSFTLGSGAIIVARDDRFADALASSTFVGGGSQAYSALLYTGRDELSAATLEQVRRTASFYVDCPESLQILIVGGPAAVSPRVAEQLAEYAPVIRLAGPDRVATAVALARHAWQDPANFPAANGTVYIARSHGPADAPNGVAAWVDSISVAPHVSGQTLLLNPTAELSPVVEQFLTDHDGLITKIVLLGGYGAISIEVEQQIEALGLVNEDTGAPTQVTRVGGVNRAETAHRIHWSLWPDWNRAERRHLAINAFSSTAWASALAVASYGYPTILTDGNDVLYEQRKSMGAVNDDHTLADLALIGPETDFTNDAQATIARRTSAITGHQRLYNVYPDERHLQQYFATEPLFSGAGQNPWPFWGGVVGPRSLWRAVAYRDSRTLGKDFTLSIEIDVNEDSWDPAPDPYSGAGYERWRAHPTYGRAALVSRTYQASEDQPAVTSLTMEVTLGNINYTVAMSADAESVAESGGIDHWFGQIEEYINAVRPEIMTPTYY